jgi:hypothetical protein
MLHKDYYRRSSVEWSAGKWRVSWWVRELRSSCCELLLLEAGSWGMGIVQEPRVRGMSASQATTGEDTAGWKRLSVCCRELKNVWISDSAIVMRSYDLYVCMYVWGVGQKIQPLHRDLQWSIVLPLLIKPLLISHLKWSVDLLVTICKWSINTITNPNPFYSHSNK